MSAIIINKCYTSSFLKITNFSLYDVADDVMLPRIKINWGTIAGLVPEGMGPEDGEHSGAVMRITRDCYVYAHAEYNVIEHKWSNAKILLCPIGFNWEINPPETDNYAIQYYYKLIGSIVLKKGIIHKILTHTGNVEFNLKPIPTERPLHIIDATEEPGKPKIRIKWGTIANLQPEGFEPGDFPGYYVETPESCLVYAAAEFNPEKMIWEKSWIQTSQERLYATSTTAYKLIGSIQVFEGKIVSIANPPYGDVTLGLQDLYLHE